MGSEPWLDARFRALENVVLMPHYAAVTAQARAEMGASPVASFAELFGAG